MSATPSPFPPSLGRRKLLANFAALSLMACGPSVTGDPADRVPAWQLEDVQPASDRYEEVYGLEAFAGTALLVALLPGENDRAPELAAALESLYAECLDEGLSVSFCIVNRSGDDGASALAEAVSFPVFQDRADVGAWRRHGGVAFDVFVYSPDGVALEKLNLSREEGGALSESAQARLKEALSFE
jgi:hypothetical protein